MIRKIALFLFSVLLVTACKEVKGPDFNAPGSVFLSNWDRLQMVGDFQDTPWDLNTAPDMHLVGDWQWELVLRLPARKIKYKLVPEGQWNLAYGDTSAIKNDSLQGYVDPNAGGLGDHIETTIPQAGLWKVDFNEQTLFYQFTYIGAAGGAITGHIEFENDSEPPFPAATVTVYDTAWSAVTTVTSDSTTGDFIASGLDAGNYSVVINAGGYIPDTVTDVTVAEDDTTSIGTVTLAQIPEGMIVIDGVISDEENWTLVDSGVVNGLAGACLYQLFVSSDTSNLYVAITTRNEASWGLAYGFGFDVADGGYSEGTSDGWGRHIGFSGYGIDYELYFWWPENGDAFTAANFIPYQGGWGSPANFDGQYAWTGSSDHGLQTLEIAIPWNLLGGARDSLGLIAWIAGGDNSSAVSSIPDDPTIHDADPNAEWTDNDTFTNIARITLGR